MKFSTVIVALSLATVANSASVGSKIAALKKQDFWPMTTKQDDANHDISVATSDAAYNHIQSQYFDTQNVIGAHTHQQGINHAISAFNNRIATDSIAANEAHNQYVINDFEGRVADHLAQQAKNYQIAEDNIAHNDVIRAAAIDHIKKLDDDFSQVINKNTQHMKKNFDQSEKNKRGAYGTITNQEQYYSANADDYAAVWNMHEQNAQDTQDIATGTQTDAQSHIDSLN